MSIVAAYMLPHPPLIIPEIGNGKEIEISKTIESYRKATKEILDISPDTIVIATPHVVCYADYNHISPGKHAVGDFREFGNRNIEIKATYDTEFVEKMCDLAEENDIMAGILGERDSKLDHATMIPLYFIENKSGKPVKPMIVRIGLSGLSYTEHYKLGMLVKQVANLLDRKTVFIASGDLSHRLKDSGPYGYQKEGPEYDHQIMNIMGEADFGKLLEFNQEFCSQAAECGHRAFIIMAGALDKLAVKAEKMSYEGPFGVGYGACSYQVTGEDKSRDYLNSFERVLEKQKENNKNNEDEFVRLARKSLENYVNHKTKITIPDELSPEILKKQAGAFVSLKINGQLRGCIGTISATKDSLAEEIIDNAISAGVKDPRFSPVIKEELPDLVYSVDVLGPAEDIESESQLDVKRYGVIVSQGYKRGLLLPNLEGVDSVEEQIAIAKQKAGIKLNDINVKLQRFEVVRHK